MEILNRNIDRYLNFGNRKIALANMIREGISPNEYKDPCHHGIRTNDRPLIKNKNLKSDLYIFAIRQIKIICNK